MRYLMKPHELGVLVEFYIPKKAAYQGVLHDHLRAALCPEHFRKTLRDKKADILPTLKGYLERRGVSDQEWERIVADIPDDLFGGWSMYEVDGVFVDRDERINNCPRIFEERTQVVRLIIYPDLAGICRAAGTGCSLEPVRLLVRAFMGHGTARADDFLRDEGNRWAERFPERGALERACQLVDQWITASGVFVFGYLVWSIAEAIGPREKVFWVTSVWALNINQVKLNVGAGGDEQRSCLTGR